jgi:hypothetical protein
MMRYLGFMVFNLEVKSLGFLINNALLWCSCFEQSIEHWDIRVFEEELFTWDRNLFGKRVKMVERGHGCLFVLDVLGL